MIPENIHTHPLDGHLIFQGGGLWGVLKAKILKESMKLIGISRGVEVTNPKTIREEGMEISWSDAQISSFQASPSFYTRYMYKVAINIISCKFLPQNSCPLIMVLSYCLGQLWLSI